MTDVQFAEFMAALGFGFGSIFWCFLAWLLFKAK